MKIDRPAVAIMPTKDRRLVADLVSDVEQLVVERLFDSLIEARTKLSWYGSKFPDMTAESAVRFLKFFLRSVFDAIDRGALLSFPTPKPFAKAPVVAARLLSERYQGDREAMQAG